MCAININSCFLKTVKIPVAVFWFVVVIRGLWFSASGLIFLRCSYVWSWVLVVYQVFRCFLGVYFWWTYVRCACLWACVVFRLFVTNSAPVTRVRPIFVDGVCLFYVVSWFCCGLFAFLSSVSVRCLYVRCLWWLCDYSRPDDGL